MKDIKRLDRTFYLRDDVVEIARELLGKYLFTNIDGKLRGGIITETEAYKGTTDRASHAYNGLRTKRTEIMYARGGVAYIYLCYGIHSLFNIVTNEKDIPHAILIRGIYPVTGIDIMLERNAHKRKLIEIGKGPGKVSKLLGIHYSQSGEDLLGQMIWLEDRQLKVKSQDIIIGPRVGVAYAKEDAKLPYRFILPMDSLTVYI